MNSLADNLRVLHAIASIDPSYGGPHQVLRGLHRGFQNFNLKLSILTASSGDARKDRENAGRFPGTEIIFAKPVWRRYTWSLSLRRELVQRVGDFDLMHVHGVFNGLSRDAALVAREYGLPYVIEPFGTLSPYCLEKSRVLKTISLGLGERANIERASSLRFTSPQEQENAKLNFKIRDSFWVPNGISWREFEELPPRGALRRRLIVSDEERLLFFLGRLQPIKGLELLIPAFIRWRNDRGALWRLVLAGPDERGYRAQLERLVRKEMGETCVHLTGPLYGHERLEAFADADVVALVSHHENFGLSLAEGMAAGKPVLVSDRVDLAELVKQKDIGEAAELTIKGIERALDRLAGRESEWPSMGRRGREHARRHFDWQHTAEVIYKKYRQLAEEPR